MPADLLIPSVLPAAEPDGSLAGALEKHFGFRAFLDAQEDVVRAILGGEEVLCVLPTGGGKSLCYQLPACVLEGVTVVVSPLIALMKDQVDALERRGIAATLVNSTLTFEEQKDRLRRLAAGEFKLIYIAPERFRSRAFLEALGKATIALFAIDEAHCISQWGHDFRPDYFRLNESIEKLGRPQVAAFTATATPEVRKDIIERLGLEEPRIFVSGFARPNLRLLVTHAENDGRKFDRLRELTREHKTGIIYCATRKKVELVFEQLREWKVKAIAYHGGMGEAERDLAQDEFISRRADVAVATNAFGMGIDRSDTRFVAHFEVPGSLEAYYQEAGRAGRDGEPAVCELLFQYADTRVQEFFIEGGNPPAALIRQIYDTLRGLADDQHELRAPIKEIAERVSAGDPKRSNEMAVSSALSILHRLGALDRFDVPGERVRGTRLMQPDVRGRALELDEAALSEKERRDRSKLRAMLDFVYARDCRQRVILRYFGETDPPGCGSCDNCQASASGESRRGTDDEWVLARKALSGVARMSERGADGEWRGRFGRGRVVNCLLGSKSQDIVTARLDQLSTHGLLKHEGASFLNELFREFQDRGLIAVSDGQYPLVTLTSAGEEVMRGKVNPELRWPSRSPGSNGLKPAGGGRGTSSRTSRGRGGAAPESSNLPPVDARLLAALREKRDEFAREEGDKPRYLIFNDETLQAFARFRPKTTDAGRRIRGVGEYKAERYLPAFIEIIARHGE